MDSSKVDVSEIPSYKDVSQRVGGTKLKIVEVLDKEIIIWKYEMRESVYREEDKRHDKNFMKIDISFVEEPDKHFAIGTSSYYLTDEIQQLRNNLPFRSTITKKALTKRKPDENQRYAYVLS